MDNLFIRKIWEDVNIKEWEVTAQNQFVKVKQTVYIQDKRISEIVEILSDFIETKNNVYFEIGKKEGNYTPALSMEFNCIDLKGNVNIELDMEVADNEERKHRCSLYVKTDLGAIEGIMENLKNNNNYIKLYEQ